MSATSPLTLVPSPLTAATSPLMLVLSPLKASPILAALTANRQRRCLTGGQAPLGHGTDALKLVLAPPRGGASFLKCVIPEAHGPGKAFLPGKQIAAQGTRLPNS